MTDAATRAMDLTELLNEHEAAARRAQRVSDVYGVGPHQYRDADSLEKAHAAFRRLKRARERLERLCS